MNLEQNNNLENKSLESDNSKEVPPSQEVLNDNSEILEKNLENLKNEDEEKTNQELSKIRESIISGNLENNQEQESDFELKIKENETDFDYLGRLSEFLVDKQEDQDNRNNPRTNEGVVKLLKKKSQQINQVYQDKDNEELIRESFIEAIKSVDNKETLNDEENKRYLDSMEISSSSRNMEWDLDEKSKHDDKVDFFSKTNQIRSFFPSSYKKDGIYYSGSFFNVHSNLPEAKEYIKNKLDGKTIYFLGGGKSANDLLHDNEINPKQVINIDPFISEEEIERNKKGSYTSISKRADSKDLQEEIRSQNIELADEMWASYSVPFYNESQEEINNLFNNIEGLLKEGGNCRITPLSTQNEQSKQAMLDSLKSIVDSKEYNIHLHKNTLIIHKLEKEY